MAIIIIDTLFMTKTAEKPYPFGPHIPIYSPYKGVPPRSSFLIRAWERVTKGGGGGTNHASS